MKNFVTFRCTTSSGRTKVVSVQGPEFLIGRAEDCGFRIALPDVSRRHCRIELSEFGVAFTDVRPPPADGAKEQTELRQHDVHNGKGMLNVGDELFIGSTRLVLENYAGYALPEPEDGASADQVQLTDSSLMPAVHAGASRTQLAFSPLAGPSRRNPAWDGVLGSALEAPRMPRRKRVWVARDNLWRCCAWLLGVAALATLAFLCHIAYKHLTA